MAERNTAEALDEVYEIKYSTDAMTGGADKRMYLYYQLANSIKKADSVDIIVSFLMESGVKMLLGELDNALKRGAKIRILTGNYLGITQPSALYLIKHKLGDQVDLRFYNEKNRSFHPKSYMFHYKDYSELYIGSSNISRSALTSGIEWNYRFSNKTDPINYEKFYNTFVDLFENHSIVIDDEELKKYSKNWHRPAVSKDLDRYDLQDDKESSNQIPLFEPRGAQIEALCALENTRAEGAKRALVQAATGVGKTYLAAFDSKNYERVLFVAHREEILKQAAESFKNVRDSDDYGFFNGDSKCTDKSVIFASVATLGRPDYLNEKYFAPDYFTYVVIDEFHHAVNEQYQRIVDYFKPKFLLGLTATPERMDGKNIYEICDYNVPYEISLKEAINKGMLVPFHYYGIFDETDYSKLHIVRGRYDEKELNETYIGNVSRYELIYKYYCKYGSRQALGFCCSREHAREMAKEFSKRGIPSVAVFSDASGEYTEDRNVAIKQLKQGKIRVIFSVDMFNEGVDITSVDMVMFLRPTESPIVFLQQLGRGLRKCRGKEFLTVLDFIGNYEKAGRVRFLLSGRSNQSAGAYNHNVIKIAEKEALSDNQNMLFVVGQVGRKYFEKKNIPIDIDFKYTAQNPNVNRARVISDKVVELFREKKLDEVYVVYTRMVNSVTFDAEIKQLLPLKKVEFETNDEHNAYETASFEPNINAVFDHIVPNYISGFVYGALVESYCSEHNARMMAMQTATDAAKDMLKSLGIEYNRARQAAITQEITEVIAGAKAQKMKED